METENSVKLFDSSNSGHGSEIDDPSESASEAIKSDSQPLSSQVTDEAPETIVDGLDESMDTSEDTNFAKQPDNSITSPLAFGVKLKESIILEHSKSASLPVQSKIGFGNHEENGTVMNKRKMDANSASSGMKRPRITVAEHQQPSVYIVYDFLPRESLEKLEELLQQWSRYHSQRCSSFDDINSTLESGEKTYFPALCIGSDKPSDVTFWMDSQTKIQLKEEFVPLDGATVPLYDRGYSLALTSADGSGIMERGIGKLDSSRCFNCCSYGHVLKDCPKPLDKVAVRNARKQHNTKWNQHANLCNSIRYYRRSRGGKYDGLAPGGLDADTRHALGLGELDPPPWLNRMREIGYPPGYLDMDVDDQPSGITIFGDVESEKETEQGEIVDANLPEPSRKMTVEFPGINAPIPKNADERLWAAASSKFCQSRESSHHRVYNHTSENSSHWRYTDRRRFRGFEDDGPPGCDPRASPSLLNHFRASPSEPWSSSYVRSLFSDRPSAVLRDAFSPPTRDHFPRYGDYDYQYFSRSPRAGSVMPWSARYWDRGISPPHMHDGRSYWDNGWHGNLPY